MSEVEFQICGGELKIAGRAYGNPEHERVLAYPGWYYFLFVFSVQFELNRFSKREKKNEIDYFRNIQVG